VILLVMLGLALLAAVSSALARARRAPQAITVSSSIAILILALIAAARVVGGAHVAVVRASVSVDGLSMLIVLLVALVGATASVYSWGYMERTYAREPARLRLYYANYNVFVFAMMAIPMVAEPTAVWILVELTTLSSALLVSFENTEAALEAAWKYVALSLMGAGIALLGFLVLFAAMQAGGGTSYTWAGLLAAAPRMPPALLKTSFLLIVVGLGTKVGFVPLHTWLPDAHSQAPSPICALLSGIETTSILYVILRLLPVLDASPAAAVVRWLPTFGLVSVGAAALLLLQVRDYKRLFAFSTVEHMGIILVAAGLGSETAHYAALYQVVCHTVTKSFCFFAAGSVVLTVTTREIASVRGLIRISPAAGASLWLGGLAIAGAPPLAVFLSEFSILKAGLAEGRYVIVGLLALFIVIAFFGVLLHVTRMVFGRAEEPSGAVVTTHSGARSGAPAGDAVIATAPALPRSCVAILLLAGALVVALGLYLPTSLYDLIRLAAQAVG